MERPDQSGFAPRAPSVRVAVCGAASLDPATAAVELVLDAHPGVAGSAVLGVPHPRTGETVRAYVVPAAGQPVTGEDLLAHCARNLARFKCPTAVELPYSAIGKVRKTQLRSVPAARPPEVPDVH